MNHFRDWTARKTCNMLSRLVRGEGERRWETTAKNRSDALEFVTETIQNQNIHPATRVKAVDLLLRMEQQNQIDERISMELKPQENAGPSMVLLLPPNSTEVNADDRNGRERTEEPAELRPDDWGDSLEGEEATKHKSG